MKKHTMIFGSVILALMILFIPNQKVEAFSSSDYININYDSDYISEILTNHSDFIDYINNNVISYLDSQPYEYVILLGNEGLSKNELFYAVVQKEDSNINFMVRSFFYKNGYANGFSLKPNNLSKRITVFNSTSFNNNEYENLNFSDYIETIDFTTKDTWDYQESTVTSINMVNNDYYGELNSDFASGYFTIFYHTNADLTITSTGVAKEFVPVTFNNSAKNYVGDPFLVYSDFYGIKQNSYDHNVELDLKKYNYFYLKFKGVGDLELFYNQSSTYSNSIYYEIYHNDTFIKNMEFLTGGDYSINDYFENVTDNDTFTLIFPIYKYNFSSEDLYSLKFSVPGLIEYGTNEFKYTLENDNWVSSDVDRSDITDLLEPSENEPDEIISSATSHNTLSNDSLNEFLWPYSLFARNGNNIKDISLIGYYSSTSTFNINDFKTNLIINYGEEDYKININNCITNNTCYLTKYEQNLIKNILFDRNVENSNYYLDFSVIPQKDIILSDSDQFNFGISINFNSSVELTINSMMLAINDLTNSYYNVYFRLYDSKGQIHTIYKTSLDSNYIGINQFQLDSRTADIYRVDLMFVYNHTSSSISSSDDYSLKFSEFNIFANTEMIHIYTENTEATYQTCTWYDLFCHGQNLFTWLIYDAPFTSDFWTIFLYITNIFNLLWTLISYIFMPFDIIPPIFDIPMSTILPFILIVLVLIKKLWFGGGD